MTNDFFSTAQTVSIPVIVVGLVELAKRLGLPTRYAPVLAVLLGLLFGIVYLSPEDLRSGVLIGLALGLSASGLYSGSRALFRRDEPEEVHSVDEDITY